MGLQHNCHKEDKEAEDPKKKEDPIEKKKQPEQQPNKDKEIAKEEVKPAEPPKPEEEVLKSLMKIIEDKELRKLVKAILDETDDDRKKALYTAPEWARPRRQGSPLNQPYFRDHDGERSFGKNPAAPNNIKIYDRKRDPVKVYPRGQSLPYDMDEDDIPTKYIPGAQKPKYYPPREEQEDLDIYSNTSSMQMDPPRNVGKDIFAKKVPKQNAPIVPPLKNIRSSSFVDPFAEPTYPVGRSERGKTEYRGLGDPKVPKTEAKTFRDRQGTQRSFATNNNAPSSARGNSNQRPSKYSVRGPNKP